MGFLKPWDYGVSIAALVITALSALFIYAGTGVEEAVIIKGPQGSWVFPLEAKEILTVPGPLGDTVVELRNGEARVLSSPCANQTCVAAGRIHSRGQWIACLPNRVLLRVEGGAKPAGGIRQGTPSSRDGSGPDGAGDELDGVAW
jgi:hypothetical protein